MLAARVHMGNLTLQGGLLQGPDSEFIVCSVVGDRMLNLAV